MLNNISILKGIKALDLLFYNYTSEDLTFMLSNREFEHVYYELGHERKIGISSAKAWEIYTAIGYTSQNEILNYALKKYEAEVERGVNLSLTVKAIFEQQTTQP